MEDRGVLAGFFALSFAFILVILIWAIISYLLTALHFIRWRKMMVQRTGCLRLFRFE